MHGAPPVTFRVIAEVVVDPSWTSLISSGVREGGHHSVVQIYGEFLRGGVAGRWWEIRLRQPTAPMYQGDCVHEGRRRFVVLGAARSGLVQRFGL